MQHQDNNTFYYTYSAKEQDEIKAIRQKYAAPQPQEEDAMTQLRRLDAGVAKKANTVSLIVGILGALIMGFGMSLVMSELGSALGMEKPLIPGIIIGIVGIAFVCCAYPLYLHVTKKEREKIAPDILRLTDKLLK